MDRRATILRLTADFSAAGAARDWDRLDTAARLLGGQLAALAAQGPWSAAEHSALALLRSAHAQAMSVCEHATEALGARLDEMRTSKAGWIAYALDSNTELAVDRP